MSSRTQEVPAFFPPRARPSLVRLVGGIALAVGAHLGLALFVWAATELEWITFAPIGPPADDTIEVVSVAAEPDPATSEPRSGAARDEERAQKQRHEALPSGQVVDVAAGNDQRPDDTPYLAEHDNRVDHQTRARVQTPFYGRAMPQQTTNQPAPGPLEQRLHGNQGSSGDPARPSPKTVIARREVPAPDARARTATLAESATGEAPTTGDATTGHGDGSRLLLRPGALASADAHDGSDGQAGTPDTRDAAHGNAPLGPVGAAPNDLLENVPVGDGTFLNTREFKYASFFNRVKQAVGEQWSPNDVIRRKDPRGWRVADRTRVTIVDVALDGDGHLIDVRVSQSCGVEFLDTEAVAAFQRAAPFVNPPEALLGSDGLLRFRFSFHLENNGSGGMPLVPGGSFHHR